LNGTMSLISADCLVVTPDNSAGRPLFSSVIRFLVKRLDYNNSLTFTDDWFHVESINSFMAN
jgi:hypothetical protein